MSKKATIKIVELATGDVVQEIDASRHVGSSNYDRMLNGMYRKVDMDRFYVDSAAADEIHDAKMAERIKVNDGTA